MLVTRRQFYHGLIFVKAKKSLLDWSSTLRAIVRPEWKFTLVKFTLVYSTKGEMTNLKLMSYFEGIATLSVTTLGIRTFRIMTLSITTFSIMTLSFKGLCVTLSINDNNQNNSLRSGSSLCWMWQFIYCYAVLWRHFEGVTTFSRATLSIFPAYTLLLSVIRQNAVFPNVVAPFRMAGDDDNLA